MRLRKCKEDGSNPNLALLRYINMKIKGMMYSPAQMLYNRRLRDNLPIRDSLSKPQMNSNVKQQLSNRQNKQAAYHNRSSKPRNEFQRGETVRVKVDKEREWTPAIVDHKYSTTRSYVVTTEKGRTIRRNRNAIRSSQETIEVNSPYPRFSNSLPTTESQESLHQRSPVEDT